MTELVGKAFPSRLLRAPLPLPAGRAPRNAPLACFGGCLCDLKFTEIGLLLQ